MTATIYFAGSEDIDFTLTGTAVGQSTTIVGDAAWVAGLVNTGASSTAWPPTNSAWTSLSSAQSSFWFHASISCGNGATTSNTNFLSFADSSGVGRIIVRGAGSTQTIKISTRNAAGTYTDLVTSAAGALPIALLAKLDVFVNYAVSGQVTVYLGGVSICDTGPGVDVTTDGVTQLQRLYLASLNTSNGVTWEQVIVADSDSRAMGLWKMNSNTAGNAQTWSGTATNTNKASINDATYISAASSGLIEQYKTGGIVIPSGTFTVPAVVMSSRALIGTSGPTQLEYATRVGSTDYTGGTWSPNIGTFTNNSNYIQATNPAGGSWATSDLTASTFNYGIESVT